MRVESCGVQARGICAAARPGSAHAVKAQRPLMALMGALAALLVACGKGPGQGAEGAQGTAGTSGAASAASPTGAAASSAVAASASASSSALPSLLVAPEDLLTVRLSRVAQGPVVSGSVQPAKRADLRAEIGAVVMQVLKDNGDRVRAGELLMRLDDSAIREALASAQESLRVATQAVEQADRQVQRLSALREQGMVSAQALEDVQLRRQQAQGDQVAAQTRLASAQQQQGRTLVRAPFEGVVSERRASAGDTVQVGRELLKVIDTRSMRFEGLVSADRLQDLRLGQAVSFRINGFSDRSFSGSLQRIDSSVNAATRQVGVWVAFKEPQAAPPVAGLFAEGRIETGSAPQLSLAESAIVRQGDGGHVWRVDAGRISKVTVRLGERDNRSGEWPVISGLTEGQRVLRNPGSQLKDGQAVSLQGAASAAKP